MFELSLFPLNTVLFPGMPITLHIFEARYKRMMSLCLDEGRPFGVVLIKEGREAHGPLAIPYTVGCTAHITNVQPLDEGRMNLIAVGQERFHIDSLNTSGEYLVGQVTGFPLVRENDERIETAARRLRPLVKQYLHVLAQLEITRINPDRLPDVPIPLAYLAASILQMPNEEKQRLLSIEYAADFIDTLREVYRREVVLLPALFLEDAGDSGPFSQN